MTAKTNELFSKYQARRTKKEKTSFIQYICSLAASAGYLSSVDKSKSHARNIIIGDLAESEIVYTAYYDTSSASLLPSFVTPSIPVLTTLYQVLIALVNLAAGALGFAVPYLLLSLAPIPASITMLISIILAFAAFVGTMILTVSGRSRDNSANSNTSGVATIVELMSNMPEEYRNRTAFVLFDLHDIGCVGSAEFAKRHKKHLKKKLIVNLDSVGVGDEIVVSLHKHAKSKKYRPIIEAAFDNKNGFEVCAGGVSIPSDHKKFKTSICVSAFKRSKLGFLYLANLNSNSDTECSGNNIEIIRDALLKLAEFVIDPRALEEANTLPAVEKAPEEAVETDVQQTDEAEETATEAEAEAADEEATTEAEAEVAEEEVVSAVEAEETDTETEAEAEQTDADEAPEVNEENKE